MTGAPFAAVCDAVSNARYLELSYGGHARVVEVHIVGTSRDGEALMRVWQVRGGSVSGEPAGWKMFHLDRVTAMRLTDEPSRAPRPGYQRNDPAIVRVICQV